MTVTQDRIIRWFTRFVIISITAIILYILSVVLPPLMFWAVLVTMGVSLLLELITDEE